MTAIQDLI